MKILVLNSGSNSLKFELIDAAPNPEVPEEETRWGSRLFSGAYDDIGKPQSNFSVSKSGKEVEKSKPKLKTTDTQQSSFLTGSTRTAQRNMDYLLRPISNGSGIGLFMVQIFSADLR